MKLHFTSPDFQGQSCVLPEGKSTVGRAPGNTIVIQHSSVSAHHCELLVHGHELIVRENGSANGTWVAGTRVAGQRPVANGDVIRFGLVEARIEFPELEPDERTELTAVHLLRTMKDPTTIAKPPEPVVISRHADEDVSDRTIAMPGVPQHVREQPEPVAPPSAEKGGMGKAVWVFVGLAIVALAVWYWWHSHRTP